MDKFLLKKITIILNFLEESGEYLSRSEKLEFLNIVSEIAPTLPTAYRRRGKLHFKKDCDKQLECACSKLMGRLHIVMKKINKFVFLFCLTDSPGYAWELRALHQKFQEFISKENQNGGFIQNSHE